MAIWQYTLRLLPKNELEELGSTKHLSLDDYDRIDFWRNKNYTLDFFKPITRLLNNKESWSKDIKLYGTEESNCIEIFMDTGNISEILFA